MKIEAWYSKGTPCVNDVVCYQIVVTGDFFRIKNNSLKYRCAIARAFSDCIKNDVKERIYRTEEKCSHPKRFIVHMNIVGDAKNSKISCRKCGMEWKLEDYKPSKKEKN